MVVFMSSELLFALCQLNSTVGDIEGNIKKLRLQRKAAASHGVDLIITPEMFVVGYPPEDLVLRVILQDKVRDAVSLLAKETADGGPAILIGAPWVEDGQLFNSALLLADGAIQHVQHKYELPNYGVFDEKRVFTSGNLPQPIPFKGIHLGVVICEDLWQPDVTSYLASQGANVFVVMNASPFEMDKYDTRLELASRRIKKNDLPLMYLNLVGGQDDLVFDGGSFVMDRDSTVFGQAKFFTEDMLLCPFKILKDGKKIKIDPIETTIQKPLGTEAAIYQALLIGLKDYVEKNGFEGVIIGLSGGIDSALTAAVAVDALGADKVRLVMLPSAYTTKTSIKDASDVATVLGVKLETYDIAAPVTSVEKSLAAAMKKGDVDLTEQNIQSRLRGLLLMALSNLSGWMVVSTGNKSELSTGYATLYGDMCGGFNLLKDVYKTLVYKLCAWRNHHHPLHFKGPRVEIFNQAILTKAPTAELKPDQKDQDTLPPYDVLDEILQAFVDLNMPVREIMTMGFDKDTVRKVWKMLETSEFKRRQAAPGPKITKRSFGKDRRYPITNRFQGFKII